MGVNKETFEQILKQLDNHKGSKIMVELGNQVFDNICMQKYKLASPICKKYFEDNDWKHTSIDINGKDGALPLNLNTILNEKFGATVVTNLGTLEHVENQYNCLKNIHNFTKIGGLMIHCLPEVDHWPRHCKYYYTLDFFKYLALSNNYTIIYTITITHPDNLLFVVLKKNNNDEFTLDKKTLLEHICITQNLDFQSYPDKKRENK